MYEAGNFIENVPESRARECVIFGRAANTGEKKVLASAEGASEENLADFAPNLARKLNEFDLLCTNQAGF